MEVEVSLQVFDLLDRSAIFRHSRLEVGSAAFSRLRRAVRGLIVALRESGDDWIEDQLLRLQRQLAHWLTTPCSFQRDASDDLVNCLGEVERLCARWGGEVATHLETALAAAGLMAGSDTLLQRETSKVIARLASEGRDFRILCHRIDRRHFLECVGPEYRSVLSDRCYLHTAREYRDSEPFEVLLKVGPLRSEGWGASPSAILSAPRFGELVQIVWTPTADDPQFGVDPVLGAADDPKTRRIGAELELPGAIRWNLTVHACGEKHEDEGGPAEAMDDFGLLSTASATGEGLRAAVLLAMGGGRGVLYPPGAFVLTFDPAVAGERSVRELQVGDEIKSGIFLVWPRVDDDPARVSGGVAGHQHELWRAMLSAELARDAPGFARRLRAGGLNLAHPEHAARHWARPPTTVIHAPKKKRHFDILMKVLGVPSNDGNRKPWIEGWREVRQSRGEAIQAGVQENAMLMDRCVAALRSARDRISEEEVRSGEFRMELTSESGLFGALHFMRIEGVEDGYRAPDAELRQIQELDELVRWRA